jgi:hypothetical protein
MFFFEKKNQKTFFRWVPRQDEDDTAGDEGVGANVFCFFLSKKKTLLPWLTTRRRLVGCRAAPETDP